LSSQACDTKKRNARESNVEQRESKSADKHKPNPALLFVHVFVVVVFGVGERVGHYFFVFRFQRLGVGEFLGVHSVGRTQSAVQAVFVVVLELRVLT
jgi:hypothetical protein